MANDKKFVGIEKSASSKFRAIWSNKKYRIGIICGICLIVIALVWIFVACVGDKSQPDIPAVIQQESTEKLTPREKVKRKIPLTEQEKRELAKDMAGDFSKLNKKPVEDKGF